MRMTQTGPPNALKTSGFLSAIGQAIEDEEYRKARAEVNRKGFGLEGYSIEGVSIGGHETCIIVPELKSVFDIGRCPSRAVHQNFLFITHAHLDHIVRSLKYANVFARFYFLLIRVKMWLSMRNIHIMSDELEFT